MRRIIISVSIALLTFVIGVAAYFLLLAPTKQPEKTSQSQSLSASLSATQCRIMEES